MGDRLRRTNHLSISPSHPGQLSLLLSAGQEMMSTSQSAVMLYGWRNVWVADKALYISMDTLLLLDFVAIYFSTIYIRR